MSCYRLGRKERRSRRFMNSKGRYSRQSAKRDERRRRAETESVLRDEDFVIPPDAQPSVDKDYVFPLGVGDVELRAYAHSEINGMVVKFSVALFGKSPVSRKREEFYSIDSSHGVIHCHCHVGTRRLKGRELERIPSGDWNFVNDWYQKAIDKCLDVWENEYDRWRSSF